MNPLHRNQFEALLTNLQISLQEAFAYGAGERSILAIFSAGEQIGSGRRNAREEWLRSSKIEDQAEANATAKEWAKMDEGLYQIRGAIRKMVQGTFTREEAEKVCFGNLITLLEMVKK